MDIDPHNGDDISSADRARRFNVKGDTTGRIQSAKPNFGAVPKEKSRSESVFQGENKKK